MRHTSKTRRIGIIALPGVQLLDVAGPLDVFSEANVQSGLGIYETSVIAIREGAVTSSSGMRILPDWVIGGATDIPKFDTLLVAGAPHLREILRDSKLLEWLKQNATKVRRLGSVCSGALVLAATGLLGARRVTTHWAVADELHRLFPDVIIEIDALHVRDGKIRTAAGVTAGLDLALALVEEDVGREVAKRVASHLVMFFRRPGGQLQFSRRGDANPTGRSALQQVQRWVIANPSRDASTSALSARVGLSPRHFVRVFSKEIGMTPAAWVEQVRVDLARRMLEAGERPKQAAAASGLGDISTFRRAFQRQMGVTPSEYRRRYEVLSPN